MIIRRNGACRKGIGGRSACDATSTALRGWQSSRASGRGFGSTTDRIGIAPANPLAAVRAMRDRARGAITYGEMDRRLRMRESRDTSALYAGHAVKQEAAIDRS